MVVELLGTLVALLSSSSQELQCQVVNGKDLYVDMLFYVDTSIDSHSLYNKGPTNSEDIQCTMDGKTAMP